MQRSEIPSLVDVSAPRRRPLIIAHRGARREFPENTLPALQRALDLGANGVEFDVLLTSDRVPIITHNDDLSILTHYHGYAHATPFDTVRALDVGSHFSAASAGATMPTLAEALELLARYDVTTVVEIKGQPGFKVMAARLVGGMIADIRLRGRVVISSSCPRILHELRRSHPRSTRALILKRRPFPFFTTAFFAKFAGLSAMHPSIRTLTPKLVKRLRALGCELFAWTANEAAEINRCLELGVDGIITDDVAFTRRHVDAIIGTRGS